jgi:hypothetical protein
VNHLEVTATAGAHAITGVLLGSTLDHLFPPITRQSPQRLLIETAAQFSVGFLSLTEVMNVLLPAADDYTSPISDGTLIYFFYTSQPIFQEKLLILIDQSMHYIRGKLTGKSVAPPEVTTKSVKDDKGKHLSPPGK